MRHQFATVHELARIEMLAGLPGATLVRLAERMERRALSPGEAVFVAEEGRSRFYVVLSGMLSAAGHGVLRPGDTSGGLTLSSDPLKAIMPSTVASCDQATFDEYIRPLLTG